MLVLRFGVAPVMSHVIENRPKIKFRGGSAVLSHLGHVIECCLKVGFRVPWECAWECVT